MAAINTNVTADNILDKNIHATLNYDNETLDDERIKSSTQILNGSVITDIEGENNFSATVNIV